MPATKPTPTYLAIEPESIRQLIEPLCVAIGRQDSDGILRRLDEVATRNQDNHSENRDRRHKLASEVQVVSNQQFLTEAKVAAQEIQIRTLIGDGTGQGGVLNELKAGQNKQGEQLAAIASDMAVLKQGLNSTTITNSAVRTLQTWQSQWKGVAIALGLLTTFVTFMGAVASAFFWLFRHGGH